MKPVDLAVLEHIISIQFLRIAIQKNLTRPLFEFDLADTAGLRMSLLFAGRICVIWNSSAEV